MVSADGDPRRAPLYPTTGQEKMMTRMVQTIVNGKIGQRIALLIVTVLIGLVQTPVLSAQADFFSQANKPGNMGREFWFSFPTPSSSNFGLHAYVNIFCPQNCMVIVENADQSFHTVVSVQANVIMNVAIPMSGAIVYQKSDNQASPSDQVYPGKGLHVLADFPIVMNAVMSSNYSTDSFLVLPLQALGNQYSITTGADWSWKWGSANYVLPTQVLIIAAENSTNVQITLGGTNNGGSAGGQKVGQIKSISLNKGDVYSIATSQTIASTELSATLIKASKYVSVVCGNCGTSPSVDCSFSGYLAECQLPVHQWGRSLLVPRYSRRTTSYFLKLVGNTKNTSIYNNGSFYRVLQCTTPTDGNSFFSLRSNSSGNTVSYYSSSAPVSGTVFNSCSDGETGSYLGDGKPYQMCVIPEEQFVNMAAILPVPDVSSSYLSENFLGVVFQLDGNGAIPANLEYGTMKNGSVYWRPFTAVFGQDVSEPNKFNSGSATRYAFKECVISGKDLMFLRCPTKFCCYTYCGGSYVGSGNFACCSSFDLNRSNDGDAPDFHVTATDTAAWGTVTDMPNDTALRSNLSHAFLNYGSSNVSLNIDPITSQNIISQNWSVVVLDTTKDATAYLTVSDRAGNDTTLTLNFKARKAVIPPTISISGTGTLCEGDSVTLRCSNGYEHFLWSTGDTTQQITEVYNTAGTYSITVQAENSDGKWSTSKAQTITVNPLPHLTAINKSDDTLSVPTNPSLHFNWFLNGTLMSGQNSNRITIPQTATYSVKAIDNVTGCVSDTVSLYAEKIIPESVSDELSSGWRLYPNPTRNELNVEGPCNAHIEVIDNLGRTQASFEKLYDHTILRLGFLDTGSYTVFIKGSDNRCFSFRVLLVQ